MKKLLWNLWKKTKVSITTTAQVQLEYRFNFFVDAILQPVLAALIECSIWYFIVNGTSNKTLGGFGPDYYVSYMLWAPFFSRINSNWMYEMRMVADVETGSINALLLRPISFFHYYFAQFFGYKLMTAVFSLVFPILISPLLPNTTLITRLPIAVLQSLYYLLFVFMLSFLVTCLAFFVQRVNSVTMVKNIGLMLLAGDLFPFDILPSFYKNILVSLPFAAGCYLPVGYLTGRIDFPLFMSGFSSISLGILVLAPFCYAFWRLGLKGYSGHGA